MKKFFGLAVLVVLSAGLQQSQAGEVMIPKGASMYLVCDDKTDPQVVMECDFEISQANEPATPAQVAAGHTPLYAIHQNWDKVLTPLQDNEFSISQGDKPWKYVVKVTLNKATYECDNEEADPAFSHN